VLAVIGRVPGFNGQRSAT